MAKKLEARTAARARRDARALEQRASTNDAFPATTHVRRLNQRSRMFNVRISDEHFEALQALADQRHLPVSTMARAWLIDRLEQERRAG